MSATSTTSSTVQNVISPPLRWGIIGCGDVCEVKSGPAFYKTPNSELVAVMRRNAAKAQDYASRHKVPKWYTSVQDIVSDDQIDCFYVATPPGGDRVEIAKQIATMGKPCYMEKPLGRDWKESLQIVRIFEEKNLDLFVAFYRRYMPKFVRIKKEVMDCQLLGDLTGVSVTLHWARHLEEKKHWHYDKKISGGGLLLDVGCHMLDIVDHLVGPILDCQGIAMQSVSDQGFGHHDSKVEDNVRGIWKHKLKDGRIIGGCCSFNFCCGGDIKDEVKIMGTKGTVIFSCFDAKPAKVIMGDEVKILDAPHPEHVHQPLVQIVTNEVLGKHEEGMEPCACTGVAGSRTSKVMDHLLNNRQSWKDDYV